MADSGSSSDDDGSDQSWVSDSSGDSSSNSPNLTLIKPYAFEPKNKPAAHPQNELSGSEDLDDGDDPEPRKNGEVEAWCICFNCQVWPVEPENRCCMEIPKYNLFLLEFPEENVTCFTQHSAFGECCLSKWALTLAYWQYRSENTDAVAHSDENGRLRYVAYRQCTRLVHKRLGKNIREPLPACVYKEIRKKFPSSNGVYTGFDYS